MELHLHSLICLMACTKITLPSFSTFMVTVVLRKALLFFAIAQYSDGVLCLVHGCKHPQIFVFHQLKLEIVLLYVYCYGVTECCKEVFIKV
jgi:hypothetical protein